MKKNLILFILILNSLISYSQASSKLNNAQNTPFSVAHPPVLVGARPTPDGLWLPYITDDIRWYPYNIEGLGTYVTDLTALLYKPLSYVPSSLEITTALGYTPYNSSNPSGYISSYTETDPIWTGVSGNYRTKAQNDLLYEPIFTKNSAFNKNFGTSSGTVTEGNDSRVNNGQTAFSWGNHASAGYITASSTNTLTNKSGNISQWTNDSGYLTNINSGQVITALGFTPVANTRTLTINGTSFDLSANRTWTVGDVLTSGSYANPTWLTSLAYSKLTGTPTIPSNTSQITESTNLYYTDARARSAISLTTAGSGAATYNNSTGVLNIPTGTNYTAGTGIGISSGVISNTAPDQTVVLTAGNRISITGTYPNFTISYVEPTINTPVARTVNSNFTISATKQATVTYTLTCQVTNPLLVGTSTAMAYLEYSTNAGSSWLLPSQNGNSSGVGITVTLQLTNGQTGTLVGIIPANAIVRIRTSTSGTGSVTYVTGQEVY